MPTIRPILVFAAAVALSVVILVTTGATATDGNLDQRVNILTDRVAELESELATLRNSLRRNHPDPAMEQAAATAYQHISALLNSGKVEEAKPRLAAFMDEYGNTRSGRQASQLNQELAVIGRPMPGTWKIEEWFQGQDDIDLDASGPTVLVFWETWCPHCRREVPKLQELYSKYQGQGLQILGLSKLSRGTTEEAVMKFSDENGLKFSLAKEDGTLSNYFGVGGIPAVAVVKGQKVVWRGHPARITPVLLDSWLQ